MSRQFNFMETLKKILKDIDFGKAVVLKEDETIDYSPYAYNFYIKYMRNKKEKEKWIKIYDHKTTARSVNAQVSILREATVMEELNHPAIIRINRLNLYCSSQIVSNFEDFKDLGDYNEYFNNYSIKTVLVTYFFPGERLSNKYKGIKNKIKLMIGITSAVRYMHSKGIVHRLICPDNILVNIKDEPLLVNFSFSKEDDRNTEQTVRINDYIKFYAPPEFTADESKKYWDLRTHDVYSLGVTLYFILLAKKALSKRIDENDIIRLNCNEKLKKIIKNCIKEDPRDRLTSNQVYKLLMEVYLNREVDIIDKDDTDKYIAELDKTQEKSNTDNKKITDDSACIFEEIFNSSQLESDEEDDYDNQVYIQTGSDVISDITIKKDTKLDSQISSNIDSQISSQNDFQNSSESTNSYSLFNSISFDEIPQDKSNLIKLFRSLMKGSIEIDEYLTLGLFLSLNSQNLLINPSNEDTFIQRNPKFSQILNNYVLRKKDDAILLMKSIFGEYLDITNNVHRNQINDLSKITRANIAPNVDTIEKDAFNGCENLLYVNIPPSVQFIEDGAFKNCTNLLVVNIPSSVCKFGKECFFGCKNLLFIEIPGSIISIPSYAFYDCEMLKGVSLNEGLEIIEKYAFDQCPKLRHLVLPHSLNIIEEYAFKRCKDLKIIQKNKDTQFKKKAFDYLAKIL